MTSKKGPTFRTASTGEEVAEAVAIDCWWRDHDEAECPPEKVPTLRDLADYVERLDSTDELNYFAIPEGPGAGSWAWAWSLAMSDEEAAAQVQEIKDQRGREQAEGREDRALLLSGILAAIDRYDGHWPALTAFRFELPTGRVLPITVQLTIEGLHTLWLGIPPELRPAHPLAALVRSWQEAQPERVRLDTHDTGIVPLVLGEARGGLVPAEPEGSTRLAAALSAGGIPAEGEQGQLRSRIVGPTVLAPWLSLVDATGEPLSTRGCGAPLVHRLFIEAQMSIAIEDRTRGSGKWLTVPGRDGGAITLREVAEWIYPRWQDSEGCWHGGWRREYLSTLRQGMGRLHNLRFEWDGWELGLAMFGRLPTAGARLDDALEFYVRYLLGSERGPLVDREALRVQGLTSAPRWRLYLRLAYIWDKAAGRNGSYRIYATRPVVNRDKEGFILDQNGKRVFVRGKPTKNAFHPKAVRIYDKRGRPLTERNPRVDRLLELDRNDLARLAFDEHLTPGNRRRRIQLAREALKGLEDAGLVACFEGPNGGVRVAETYRERKRSYQQRDRLHPTT